MKAVQEYFASLFDPEFRPMAFRVALVVGSILFTINHGAALLGGQMSRDRWLAAALTYVVPYLVNVHGQYTSRRRTRQQTEPLPVLLSEGRGQKEKGRR